MPHLNNKPPLAASAVAAALDQLSKAALLDLVVDLVQRQHGADMEDQEILQRLAGYAAPVLRERGDRWPKLLMAHATCCALCLEGPRPDLDAEERCPSCAHLEGLSADYQEGGQLRQAFLRRVRREAAERGVAERGPAPTLPPGVAAEVAEERSRLASTAEPVPPYLTVSAVVTREACQADQGEITRTLKRQAEQEAHVRGLRVVRFRPLEYGSVMEWDSGRRRVYLEAEVAPRLVLE